MDKKVIAVFSVLILGLFLIPVSAQEVSTTLPKIAQQVDSMSNKINVLYTDNTKNVENIQQSKDAVIALNDRVNKLIISYESGKDATKWMIFLGMIFSSILGALLTYMYIVKDLKRFTKEKQENKTKIQLKEETKVDKGKEILPPQKGKLCYKCSKVYDPTYKEKCQNCSGHLVTGQFVGLTKEELVRGNISLDKFEVIPETPKEDKQIPITKNEIIDEELEEFEDEEDFEILDLDEKVEENKHKISPAEREISDRIQSTLNKKIQEKKGVSSLKKILSSEFTEEQITNIDGDVIKVN